MGERCAARAPLASIVLGRADRSSVGSAALAGRLRAGAVAPAALGTMSGTEMCPEATADIRAELERRARCEVARRVSRMYRCPRCHERACIYAAKRMSLGGDEATGLAIECTVCGHAWKG